jgi:predicted O-methyltransferase YrrM
MISFADVVSMVATVRAEVRAGVDTRPPWLQAMPSASDTTALYYRFFHHLTQQKGPLQVLEIGTYYGSSACHFAYADLISFVRTIDCDPGARITLEQIAAERSLMNVEAITSDSLVWAYEAGAAHVRRYDVLFIDGLHQAAQVNAEYEAYRPLVRDDGLIFFDDIDLGDMDRFWRAVLDPKIRLDDLHYTGFGCCQVRR